MADTLTPQTLSSEMNIDETQFSHQQNNDNNRNNLSYLAVPGQNHQPNLDFT